MLLEIAERGVFRRGDFEVFVERRLDGAYLAEAVYKLKRSLPASLPEDKGVEVRVRGGSVLLRSSGESKRGALRKVIRWALSVRYPDVHVTRRAGCYVEIREGRVVRVGRPRLSYCPLAARTFRMPFTKESIIEGFAKRIGEGMFCEERCVSRRRDWVLYGASEIMADALEDGLIDAAVTVCEGAGTVVSSKPEIVQGMGAKMTGVFLTSPMRTVIDKLEESSLVVFPFTAEIDQLKGVELARERGFRRLAVTFASGAVRKMRFLDEDVIKLAVCTTGIGVYEASVAKERADIVWGCASKNVRKIVAPHAVLQLGIKIPVFVMTEKGLELVKARIKRLSRKLWMKMADLRMDRRYCIWRRWPSSPDEEFRMEEAELPVEGDGPTPLL